MPRSPGRTGRPWLRLRAQVIAEEHTCCLCGGQVDKTLPGTHPWGPTIQHVTSLNMGGAPRDRNNTRLAHRTCNLRAGDGSRRRRHTPPRKQSRAW
jgi:5-methylcytosine-specific restriction endonuclease McrA